MAFLFYLFAGINTVLAFMGGVFSCLNLGAAVFSFGMGVHCSIAGNKVKIEFVQGDDDDAKRGN